MAGSAPFAVSFSGVTKAVRAGGRGKGEEDGGGGEDVRLWLFRLRLRLRTILAAAAITLFGGDGGVRTGGLVRIATRLKKPFASSSWSNRNPNFLVRASNTWKNGLSSRY